MIIGIGSDIIDIRRIEKSLARFGTRFINRIFTPTEQQRSEGRAQRAASYAKRFAAKEACTKALGTGIGKGVNWRDIGVVNNATGKPELVLTGGAAEQLMRLTGKNGSAILHLTITDDFPIAQAIVIIERLEQES